MSELLWFGHPPPSCEAGCCWNINAITNWNKKRKRKKLTENVGYFHLIASPQLVHAGLGGGRRLEGVWLLCEWVLGPRLRLVSLTSLGLHEAVQVDEVAVLPQQVLHRTLASVLINCSLVLKAGISLIVDLTKFFSPGLMKKVSEL